MANVNTLDSRISTGPGKLVFGKTGDQNEFSALVTKAELNPSVNTEDGKHVLSGDYAPGKDTITWTMELTCFINLKKNGIWDWCFTNRGKEVEFEFRPVEGEKSAKFTGTVKVRPLGVGGEVNKEMSKDLTFPLVGEPVFTPVQEP